jgi:MSHA biogenesis protein MshM
MHQQHFGLTHIPFGKNSPELWEDKHATIFKEKFNNLLHSPGIGLLTGEAGVGKTALLRKITQPLNPNQYQVIYFADTNFTSCDVYRQLAYTLNMMPVNRYAQIWRDIKAYIKDRVENKKVLPVLIIDEAQNLPHNFFRDFPTFLNFDFDSKNMLTVWFVGHPVLNSILKRQPYAALASRIQMRYQLEPIIERDRFASLIQHAFQAAGCKSQLLSDSGIELLRTASQGLPRYLHQILLGSMQLAAQKGMAHLPDDLIQAAIEQLQS